MMAYSSPVFWIIHRFVLTNPKDDEGVRMSVQGVVSEIQVMKITGGHPLCSHTEDGKNSQNMRQASGSRFYYFIGVFLAVSIPGELLLCRMLHLEGLGQYINYWPIVIISAIFLCVTPLRRREVPQLFL